MNAIYGITFDTDEKFSIYYNKRFIEFLRYVQINDLVTAACMPETKGDPSLSPSKQRDKDQSLYTVQERKRGVVVRVAKLNITGPVNPTS